MDVTYVMEYLIDNKYYNNIIFRRGEVSSLEGYWHEENVESRWIDQERREREEKRREIVQNWVVQTLDPFQNVYPLYVTGLVVTTKPSCQSLCTSRKCRTSTREVSFLTGSVVNRLTHGLGTGLPNC